VLVAGDVGIIHAGSMIDQNLKQRVLNTGSFGVNAGGGESENGGGSTISEGCCVHVGSGVEEEFCDLNDVLWSPLTVALNAVGGDVVKQSGVVGSQRAGGDEWRVIAKELPESFDVAGDDGVGRSFEAGFG
jgi:hypothetical protein